MFNIRRLLTDEQSTNASQLTLRGSR